MTAYELRDVVSRALAEAGRTHATRLLRREVLVILDGDRYIASLEHGVVGLRRRHPDGARSPQFIMLDSF